MISIADDNCRPLQSERNETIATHIYTHTRPGESRSTAGVDREQRRRAWHSFNISKLFQYSSNLSVRINQVTENAIFVSLSKSGQYILK